MLREAGDDVGGIGVPVTSIGEKIVGNQILLVSEDILPHLCCLGRVSTVSMYTSVVIVMEKLT